jgi:pantetheine-phosphate adenylyltransferase
MSTSPEHSFVSSSLVKEVASYGGDVSNYVPAEILNRLNKRVAR